MYLIRNVRLFDPMPCGNTDILVINDRIAAIGKDLKPQLEGIVEIDGRGKTAVPGFIDQHVHVIGGGGEGGFNSRTPELRLSSVIKAGVTTVVGLLGTDSFTKNVESLVAKTKALRKEGIGAFCLTGAYAYPPVTLTGSVAKDIVYIDEVIGCKLAISDHRCSRPTKEELIRLASDIRMAALVSGKPGVLHIHVGSVGRVIRDIIEIVKEEEFPVTHFRPTHMDYHLEEAIEFMEMGGWTDFTAEPEETEKLFSVIERAGISRMTVSSDSNGSIPVWDEKRENVVDIKVGGMEPLYEIIRNLIVDYNVPIETAVQLITSNVAKALNMYPERGAVKTGSLGDLVLLDEELKVDTVMAQGRLMMRDGKLLVKGAFEDIPLDTGEGQADA